MEIDSAIWLISQWDQKGEKCSLWRRYLCLVNIFALPNAINLRRVVVDVQTSWTRFRSSSFSRSGCFKIYKFEMLISSYTSQASSINNVNDRIMRRWASMSAKASQHFNLKLNSIKVMPESFVCVWIMYPHARLRLHNHTATDILGKLTPQAADASFFFSASLAFDGIIDTFLISPGSDFHDAKYTSSPSHRSFSSPLRSHYIFNLKRFL